MKRLIPLIAATLIMACLPTTPIPGAATPTAVVQASSTLTPPSATLPPTETPVLSNPTVTSIVETTTAAEVTATATASPFTPNLTATFPTSTNAPSNPSIPATATLAAGQPTLTPTLGILKYGTLPPAVPFNSITLWNRSKRQAYISLQVTTVEGYYTIIEYPVEGMVKIKAPLGSYVYVAWVGGNKMVGTFRLTSTDSLVITLFKDKVVIK
ncbi:MAG: hypothetical protein IT314_11215 [Anaerolineales bacterium]|nr:hypothetical protein [Anaerolineales bacterium]